MDTLGKSVIWAGFISFGFLAFTLQWWFISGRSDSFKQELKVNLVVMMVVSAIAAVIIYINN